TQPTDTPTYTYTPTPTDTPCSPVPCTATATRTSTTGVQFTPTPCPVNFTDVPSTNNAYAAIRYLYCANAISGYSCGGKDEPCPGQYFRPNNETTRAQLSKIIVLAMVYARHWTIDTTGGPHFNDVPANN